MVCTVIFVQLLPWCRVRPPLPPRRCRWSSVATQQCSSQGRDKAPGCKVFSAPVAPAKRLRHRVATLHG